MTVSYDLSKIKLYQIVKIKSATCLTIHGSRKSCLTRRNMLIQNYNTNKIVFLVLS